MKRGPCDAAARGARTTSSSTPTVTLPRSSPLPRSRRGTRSWTICARSSVMRAGSLPTSPRPRPTPRRTKYAVVAPPQTRHTADEKVWSNRQVPQRGFRELRAHDPLGVCAQAALVTPLAPYHAPARATASPLRWTIPYSSRHQRVFLLDKRQSGSAHVLADPRPAVSTNSAASPATQVVMGRASGSDDREQRVCRQGRDDRYAWPSDSRVIEVAASLGTARASCNA